MIRSLRLVKSQQRILATSLEELSILRHLHSENPRKTTLYDFHVARQGKMVPFAGYLLPVQYGSVGIAKSHDHTRHHASLFDVSHMMQSQVRGKDRLEFLESVTTADLLNLRENSATLTIFTDPVTGGILDDLIITKTALGYCSVVSNAGRRDHDQELLLKAQEGFKARGKDVDVIFYDPDVRALVALQGPSACDVLQPLTDVDLTQLFFMTSTLATVAGVQRCRITRCGYTGEDGVEISIPADQATVVAEALLQSERVEPAGLGARDSLRLEAGMCLYGHDIDHTTTPIEACLAWLIGKRRRELADFPGASVILNQLRSGPSRRRVGLISRGPPARADAKIFGPNATESVGVVTSGCPSPTLGGNIALGYVSTSHAKPGTKLQVQVREKHVEATVTKLPFVHAKYYTPSK